MAACKTMLLDGLSGGLKPVLYEFSVMSKGDFSALQDEPNTQPFNLLQGQHKKHTLVVMERTLAEWSNRSPRRRIEVGSFVSTCSFFKGQM